jgi:hypothetical protein
MLLLAVIAFILAFNLFHKTSLTPTCQAAIDKANLVITGQMSAITGLDSGFTQAAFHDTTVTGIYQQIFIANQFEFTALQMIAIQNAAILEISTSCH